MQTSTVSRQTHHRHLRQDGDSPRAQPDSWDTKRRTRLSCSIADSHLSLSVTLAGDIPTASGRPHCSEARPIFVRSFARRSLSRNDRWWDMITTTRERFWAQTGLVTRMVDDQGGRGQYWGRFKCSEVTRRWNLTWDLLMRDNDVGWLYGCIDK